MPSAATRTKVSDQGHGGVYFSQLQSTAYLLSLFIPSHSGPAIMPVLMKGLLIQSGRLSGQNGQAGRII